jgi:hypothetical protein
MHNSTINAPLGSVLKNLKDRVAICKIRISAHNLMIEKGRHLNII